MSSFTFGASIMMAVLAALQGPGSFSVSVQPKELSVLVLPPQSFMPELLL